MSYIITTRNPNGNKLVIIGDDDDGWARCGEDHDPAEFDTELAALKAAKQIPACDAWGYNIVEVP